MEDADTARRSGLSSTCVRSCPLDAKNGHDRDSFPCPSYAGRCLHAWTQVSISFAVCCSTVCRRGVTAATFPSSGTFIVPCVNSAVFSRSLSITVKNQMCGLPRVLVDGPLWIRDRLVVAACIIPFMIRRLLRRIKVQHIAACPWGVTRCTHGSRLCASASVQLVLGDHLQNMFKLDVPPQTGPFIGK